MEKRLIIFDFDRTLFDTEAFKKFLFGAFVSDGISYPLLEQTYKDRFQGRFAYSLERHIAYLRTVCSFDEQRVCKIADEVMDQTSHYVLSGVGDLLRSLKKIGYSLVLLSRGVKKFCYRKIWASGLASYFDEIVVTVDSKTTVYGSLRLTDFDAVYAVNDSMMELRELRSAFPFVQTILCRHDGASIVPEWEYPVLNRIDRLLEYLDLPSRLRSGPIQRVVTIGGGGGQMQILKAFMRVLGLVVHGVCPVSDSGGSTGLLHHQYGTSQAIGDVSKCLLALADPLFETALMHRFGSGPLHGHSVKNLLFAGLEMAVGRERALALLSGMLRVWPNGVVPVSADNTTLYSYIGRRKVCAMRGETILDTIASNVLWNRDDHPVKKIVLDPPVFVSDKVVELLTEADWIVLCPGDLYTSLLPALLPKGMKRLFRRSRARIVYAANLMTKPGETDGYVLSDFVKKIELVIGRQIDVVVANSGAVTPACKLAYEKEGKQMLDPTIDDVAFLGDRLYMADVVEEVGISARHDPYKLAVILQEVFKSYV